MPLYEFYCEPCHTIFTFRSARVDTATHPPCPKCGKSLKREISPFAHIVKGATQEPDAAGALGPDIDSRLDQMMERMGDRMQLLEDDNADPREAVRLMRDMADAGGLRFNADVREAMARIEAGEDPDLIDQEFSDAFDTENPFESADASGAATGRALLRRLRGPRRDPTWHDMPSPSKSK